MENRLQTLYKAAQSYHVRHDPPQDSPGYWDWTVKDLQAVAGQYNNDPLIVCLLGAALSDLEREHKRQLAEYRGDPIPTGP